METIINFLMNIPKEFLHVAWYSFFFLTILVEGIPVLGSFIPGQTIAVVSWLLVRLGMFSIFGTIFSVACGAVAWDYVGYFLGKKYGYAFFEKYGKYISLKKERLDKVIAMTQKHFIKASIAWRFTSFTKVIVPFAAGMSGINIKKFTFYTVISAFIWTIGMFLAWYILWESYTRISKYIGPFMTISFAIMIFMAFFYGYINKRRHIFNRRYLVILIINIVSIFVVAKTWQNIIANKKLVALDSIVDFKIRLLSNIPFFSSKFFDHVMLFVDKFFWIWFIGIVSLLLIIWLIRKKKYYHTWLIFFSIIGSFFFEIFLKFFVHKMRPSHVLTFIQKYSFPASHITLATIFFSSLWYVFHKDIKSIFWKIIFLVFCVFGVLINCFERIYVDANTLMEVVSWLALWIAWVTLIVLVLKVVLSRKPTEPRIFLP